MTNEEKRNIYNNIQNLYNMDFKSWQEVLAMMYNLVSDVEQKFENFEQRFELTIGKEVTNVLNQMYVDGSLARIINEQLFTGLDTKIDNFNNTLSSKIDTEIKKINSQMDNLNINVGNTIDSKFTSYQKTITDLIQAMSTEIETRLNSAYTENQTLINNFKQDVNKTLEKVLSIVYVKNVTELEKAIENCNDDPTIIYIIEGVYNLTKTSYIPSNTTLVGLGDVKIQADGLNCYFTNKAIDGALGYTGSHNIHIENLFFDGKGKADGLTMVAFGHAENVSIKNCTFYDLHMWHMVEFNAVKHGLIYGCKFNNYGNVGTNGTEAIQLDAMLSQAQFPWFGAYDDTACQFITIENNTFSDIGKIAIGHHSFKSGVVYKDITIKNNLFERVGLCIKINDFNNLLITENKAYDMHGFFMSQTVNNDCNTLVISKNKVRGFFISSIDGLGDERFVGLNTTGKPTDFNYYHVIITENDISLIPGHAIGLVADYLTITNNNFYRVYRNGIYHWGGHCANISNNNFRDTGMGTDTDRYAILVDGGGYKSSRIVVSNNAVANLKGICVRVGSNDVDKILVNGNVSPVVNNADTKCTVSNNIN